LYVSGFNLAYEEDSKSYSPEYEGSAGDYNFFLYHKGDKNLIIEDHDEFGYGEMSCYILEGGKIKDGDGINAGLAYSWDNAEDSEDIAPVFLPVNMNKVLVIEEVGGEEGESITCYLSVSEDGKLTLTKVYEDGDEDSEEADNKGGKSEDKEVDVAWAGEAVYYNDQILFRQYSSDAYRYYALWGEFSDDFKFEHPKDDYTIEDFVVEDAKALEDLIRSEYSKEDIIIDDGVFDENGHLVYESDRTFTNDEYVYMCHICFDADGKINYIRPVIME
jgi:hypothetical protein